MIMFKKALEKDKIALSKLAYDSEEYLGYNLEYMKRFSMVYNVTEVFIRKNPVYIMERANSPIGFWGLRKVDNCYELEFFYIALAFIGKGYGTILWDHLIVQCIKMDISEFYFVTSRKSQRFYEKMGAVVVDNVNSAVSNEMIPKLKYVILFPTKR